ncbi:MAG: hypothetical protein O2867_08600 [Bacteroidetes bacterium]|jgi:hypothetical protein|nr:hypothetical protein [Bacteroidota bacterium]
MQDRELKLIDNTYKASEAKEVLCSLINEKIRFLNLQIASRSERFGEDTSYLKQRIEQLTTEKQDIIDFMDTLDAEGQMVKVDATAAIQVLTLDIETHS